MRICVLHLFLPLIKMKLFHKFSSLVILLQEYIINFESMPIFQTQPVFSNYWYPTQNRLTLENGSEISLNLIDQYGVLNP